MYWASILLFVLVPIVSSVGLYDQCGGQGYTGSTECNWPLKCFRRNQWFSSCQTSCPSRDWECALPESYSETNDEDTAVAPNWEQCGGEGWKGPTACADYPCQPRSVWFSQCRPDCPREWLCAEIPDEEVTEEELEDIQIYDPEDSVEEEEEEETEADGFPDPSEVNLDELQRKEQGLYGEIDLDEDPFAGAPEEEESEEEEEDEEESTIRRHRRNTVRATACKANGKSGTCKLTSACKGTSVAGHCPGAKSNQCCIPKTVSKPSTGGSKPSAAGSKPSTSGRCGTYAKAPVRSIKGNGNKGYSVVKIKQTHLASPGSYSLSPSASDNTMTTSTACAFDKMAAAAKKSGVAIKIASGFRTIARQQYFWNCYTSKRCNGGNLAARPGTSNHGKGIALDLNTNCGKQTRARPNCGGSRVYQWLYKNGAKFGFTRTVFSEPWHWEFRGAGVRRASFS
ncbi:unnamed protein product [Adineta steineri]|uniref:CBM1 domain-containing protein n=1 Tax=Adineta steineri TaxID=433720 RepID=A0A813RSU2_9BILA|nr:unnamed protein product [Adineta steineri]CAF1051475.1 unnamed protein product [Adineta steineri]